MNILFTKHFVCRIYGFRDTEGVRIRVMSVFGYFPLYIYTCDTNGTSSFISTHLRHGHVVDHVCRISCIGIPQYTAQLPCIISHCEL